MGSSLLCLSLQLVSGQLLLREGAALQGSADIVQHVRAVSLHLSLKQKLESGAWMSLQSRLVACPFRRRKARLPFRMPAMLSSSLFFRRDSCESKDEMIRGR